MRENNKKSIRTVTIDLVALATSNLNVNEFLTLVGVGTDVMIENVREELFDGLVSKGYMKIDGFKPTLTNKGTSYITKYTSTERRGAQREAQPIVKVPPFSSDFISKYRAKFKGLKAGSMGYEKAVEVKMTRFFQENKNANEKDVLLAVDKYLNSLDSYTYLQQADYFIYKREQSGAESSRLAVFLEEVQSKGGDSIGGDWTVKLK